MSRQIARSEVTAGVLAGGAARRLGGIDKGWMNLGGRPLIEHVVTTVRPQVSQVLISANRNLDRYASLAEAVIPDGGQTDPPRYRGPMAGVARLMAHCQTRYLLLVPVDAPGLPPDLLVRLSAVDVAIAVAVHQGRPQWTCCLIDLHGVVVPRLPEGSLSGWMRPWHPAGVPVPDACVMSINSPSDVARAA